MEELLAAAATAMGAPEGLVRRSAAARAKATGASIEDVLRAWSGGGDIPPPAPAAGAAIEPAAEEPPSAPPASPPPEAPAPAAASSPAVEVLGPQAEGDGEDGGPSEPGAGEPEPATDEDAALIPGWLMAVFLVVPAFAVLYALFFPNGPNCGDAGALAVDPVTGVAVACDGSEYGVEVVDFFSLGRDTYAQCSSCHGENGGGGGNFPAFGDGALLQTFPEGTCSDQVEWVRLGSSGWPDPTYGATAKPVGGSGALMPAFGSVLTEEELRAVVLYERIQFAGLDLDATLADCGLDEGEEGTGDG